MGVEVGSAGVTVVARSRGTSFLPSAARHRSCCRRRRLSVTWVGVGAGLGLAVGEVDFEKKTESGGFHDTARYGAIIMT